MLDTQTCTDWRSKTKLFWLPESPDKLIGEIESNLVRQPPTRIERYCIFQAGTALMAGIRLLNNPNFLEKPHFTQTAALQLILYGCFFQLREAVRLPTIKDYSQILVKLLLFLNDPCFIELRNALAHQRGDSGATWFHFNAEDQMIHYSTRKLRSQNNSGSISLAKAVFATDLQWVLYSQAYEIPYDIYGQNT